MQVTATLVLSAWGAMLSTLLAVLNVFDRFRARPIIRVHAKFASRKALEEPRFVTDLVKYGPYNDEELREIYVEFRAENHGTKPLSLQHIYIETAKNLSYLTAESLPVVLEGQTAATFEVQKEHFDTIDVQSNKRRKPEIIEIGFVDGLDRRYPAPSKELQNLLNHSLILPTTMKLYARRENADERVIAFQVVNIAKITHRSSQEPRLRHIFGFGNRVLKK